MPWHSGAEMPRSKLQQRRYYSEELGRRGIKQCHEVEEGIGGKEIYREFIAENGKS